MGQGAPRRAARNLAVSEAVVPDADSLFKLWGELDVCDGCRTETYAMRDAPAPGRPFLVTVFPSNLSGACRIWLGVVSNPQAPLTRTIPSSARTRSAEIGERNRLTFHPGSRSQYW